MRIEIAKSGHQEIGTSGDLDIGESGHRKIEKQLSKALYLAAEIDESPRPTVASPIT